MKRLKRKQRIQRLLERINKAKNFKTKNLPKIICKMYKANTWLINKLEFKTFEE
jgi:hypothetical protein